MANQYDLVFTQDSTNYSFMCRQKGETKDFKVTDAPLLPQTLITESANPSHIQPEREIQISQVDWRKGIQDFLLADEHKYYDSLNCDARYKDMVILSPKKLTSLTYTGTPTVCNTLGNGDFEFNNLAFWSSTGTGSLYTSSTDPQGGSYCLRAYLSTGQAITIYQDLTFADSLKGRTITFNAYLKMGTETTGKIGIYDGVGTTWSTTTTASSWTLKTVDRVIDASATKLQVQIYLSCSTGSYNSFVDTCSVSGTLTGAAGSCVKQVEFGSDIVGTSGSYLTKLSGSNFVNIADFTTPITDLCVYKNRLFIALGWNALYWYTSDLSTFTRCGLSGATAKYMSNIGESQFWISDTPNTLRVSGTGINGETENDIFSTQYTVGSSAWDITGLVDHDSIVFVRKEDDVYYLSVGDVLSLLNLKSEASTTNAYGLYGWGDYLYIPSGVNSLYEYDIAAGEATVISPARYTPEDTSYDGKVLAICHDETYLYCAIDYDTKVKILAGRWENVEGDTNWYWHPIYDKTSNNITSMLISNLSGSKRLYAGTDTYSDGIYPFIVPTSYCAIYLESGYQAEASGDFITPWFTSNFPTDDKLWKSIKITSICITDKTSITPYYQIKGGNWTAMTACSTSTLPETGYPAEKSDERTINQTSERIRFKFVLATSDANYTPILYGSGGGFVTFAVLEADRKRQIEATILVAPKLRLRDNTVVEKTMSTDLSNLRTLYKSNAKMTLTAPDETQYSVILAREGYEEQLAYNPTIREENWWVSVKLLEI